MFKRHKSDKHDSALPFDPVEHLPQLDGLRGVAILLVLVFHFNLRLSNNTPFGSFFISITHWGWIGVDLFFVLSGFLITSILWRFKFSPRYFFAFYGRRVLRIFPIYFLFLFVMLLIVPMIVGETKNTFSQLWYWFHASNIAISFYGWGKLGHLWSLAMEEQYYLFWPIVVRFGNRNVITAIGLGIVLLGIVLRLKWSGADSPIAVLHVFPLVRLDGFIVGSLIAIWLTELVAIVRSANISKILLAILIVIPLGLAVYSPFSLVYSRWSHWGVTFNFTLIAIYFGILLLLLLEAQASTRLYRFFSMDSLRHLGKYSYAIYLFHIPLDILLRKLHFHPVDLPENYQILAMIPYFILMTAELYVLSRISWWLFESRFLELKRYFLY